LQVAEHREIRLDFHPDLGLNSGPERMLHQFHFGQIVLGVTSGQNHVRHMRFFPIKTCINAHCMSCAVQRKLIPKAAEDFLLPLPVWAMIRPFSLRGGRDHPS
jgi:hypothetical protein